MPADIMKGADHAICAAHDHDRIGPDLQRRKGTRFRQHWRRQGEQPVAIENVVEIEVIDTIIAVKITFQRMRGAARRQAVQHQGLIKHRTSLCAVQQHVNRMRSAAEHCAK